MQFQDLDRIVLEIISKFGVPDVEWGRYIAYAAAGLIILRLAAKGAKLGGAASWRGMLATWTWATTPAPIPEPPKPCPLAMEILTVLEGAEAGKWNANLSEDFPVGKTKVAIFVGSVGVWDSPKDFSVHIDNEPVPKAMLSALDWERVKDAAQRLRERTEAHEQRQTECKFLEVLRVARIRSEQTAEYRPTFPMPAPHMAGFVDTNVDHLDCKGKKVG